MTGPGFFRYPLAVTPGGVNRIGSAGYPGGEGEGIDATPLRSGLLHTLTIDAAGSPVFLGHFRVT